MAESRQPLIISWLWPGIMAATLLAVIAVSALGILFFHAVGRDWFAFFTDSYFWHILRFSFWQAFLAVLLAVIPALFLARALHRCHFPGRGLFLRFATMTLVLPTLVAVSGIIGIYGRQGWLAQLYEALDMRWGFSPYGLNGILLVHTFFALPLSVRLFLQTLEQIPGEQRQLAAQLGMQGRAFFRYVEWPWLRRQLPPVSALVFMLSFTSFSTVLILGGGPKSTTIELAIYQSLSFDYQPERAAMLALVQMTCCLALVLLGQRLGKNIAVVAGRIDSWRDPYIPWHTRWMDALLIAAMLLFLVPPLLVVIQDGLNHKLPAVLQEQTFWQSLFTSLRIALGAGCLCIVLSMMLLWSSRELRLRMRIFTATMLETSGMFILAIPSIVLATGFFLLMRQTVGLPKSATGIIILTNALMAIPYALKVLAGPMQDIATRYGRLCTSLNICGLTRLYRIELRALRRPLTQAFAFACVLSLGDLGVIALFGNTDFSTLPFYLFQQLDAYRSEGSAATALLLLLLSFSLFYLIERLAPHHAHPR